MKQTPIIFVMDDTGFHAQNTESEVLKNEMVTYCGLFLTQEQYESLQQIMQEMCKTLQKNYNTKEFHFTEMYNCKNAFETLSRQEFLEIADTFVSIIEMLDIDIFTQTVPKNIFETHPKLNQAFAHGFKNLQMKNKDKQKAFCLAFLQAKGFVEKYYTHGQLERVICDEGVRKEGSTLTVAFAHKPEQSPITITFESSQENPVLQMADFAAWMLTRAKQILTKNMQTLTETDVSMLALQERLAPYYVNLPTVTLVADAQVQKLPYDTVIDICNQSQKTKS